VLKTNTHIVKSKHNLNSKKLFWENNKSLKPDTKDTNGLNISTLKELKVNLDLSYITGVKKKVIWINELNIDGKSLKKTVIKDVINETEKVKTKNINIKKIK
jgi:hypothetical protein